VDVATAARPAQYAFRCSTLRAKTVLLEIIELAIERLEIE
jgi:hypothetical protein